MALGAGFGAEGITSGGMVPIGAIPGSGLRLSGAVTALLDFIEPRGLFPLMIITSKLSEVLASWSCVAL